jgi:hypothetical protein
MSNTWVTIAVEDLDGYLMAIQLDAIRTGGMREGQVDPFSIVMPDVVNTVRAIIVKRGKPVSATANTIPVEAKTHTIWLIIDALQTRIPGLIVTNEQKRHVDEAHEFLAAIGEADTAVSAPDDPVQPNVNIGGGVSVVRAGGKRFTRDTLDGFM